MVIYSSVCGHGRFKCVRNRLHKRRQNWQLLKYCFCNYVDYADLGVFLAHTRRTHMKICLCQRCTWELLKTQVSSFWHIQEHNADSFKKKATVLYSGHKKLHFTERQIWYSHRGLSNLYTCARNNKKPKQSTVRQKSSLHHFSLKTL